MSKMNFTQFKFIVCIFLLVNTSSTVLSKDLSPSQMIATSIELLDLKLGDEANKERLEENRAELYSIIDETLSPYFQKKYQVRVV